MFETERVDVSGVTAEMVSTTEFGSRDRTVLKRSDEATAMLRNEIRAAMVHHAYHSDMDDPEAWLRRKLTKLGAEFPSEAIEAMANGPDHDATVVIGDPLGVEKRVHLDAGQRIDPAGILYLLYSYDADGRLLPKYVGITEMCNEHGHLNGNINHNAESKMARWGYGRRQHVGEVSCAMFPSEHSWDPTAKYEQWVEELFVDGTRLLDRPLYLHATLWDGDIRMVEEALVRAASKAWPGEVLNTVYRS